MTDIFPVPAAWAARAKVTKESYAAPRDRSLNDAHAFWLEQAQRLDWIETPPLTNESSFAESNFGVKWFADGGLNLRDGSGRRRPHDHRADGSCLTRRRPRNSAGRVLYP